MQTTPWAQRWRCAVVLSALFISPALVSAQTGIIAGTVVEESTGETLPGVNVVIDGSTQGASTSLDGDYRIASVSPGTYTLVFTYIGFTTQRVTGVEVSAGEVTTVDLAMSEESLELGGGQEVVVEARLIRDNEFALLADRARAVQVSDAISAEEISRQGAGDAADAMKKVTGASVVDGKYVYVRGLGERYSNTTLNGAILPSADPDRKAFQLDLLPSGLIENIVTLKTFTPDKPGDFAGGLVNVATKSFPEQFALSFGLSATYDAQSSFSDNFLTYPGGGTDWLGYDDGTRGIPDALADRSVVIPGESDALDLESTNEGRLASAEEAQRLSQSFANTDLTPELGSVPVNHGLSLAVGGPATLFGGQLGYTGSFNYSRSYTLYDDGVLADWILPAGDFFNPDGSVNENNITTIDSLTQSLGVVFSNEIGDFQGLAFDSLDAPFFRNIRAVDEVNWGASGTLNYRPVRNHEFGLTLIRTQSGTTETQELGGIEAQSDIRAFRTQKLGYTERSLWNGQLRGEHLFGSLGADWKAVLGRNTQSEPDLRFFSYVVNQREFEDSETGEIVRDTSYQFPGAGAQSPTRFFRDLEEDVVNTTLDLELPFEQWSGQRAKVKVGGAFARTDRRFDERRFEYVEGPAGIEEFRDLEGDIDAYLGQVGGFEEVGGGDLVGYNLGLYISETSDLVNSYDADQTVGAGYAMLELPITSKLRVIAGARVEASDINLQSDEALADGVIDSLDVDVIADKSYTDVLPSVNVVYGLTENMNLRAAWTQTLARPTFRELAPFLSFDFVGGAIFEGNPDLDRTLITNYDVRWEWFVRPGELLAASFFYKDFQDPIERFIDPVPDNEASFINIQNVDQGRVIGAEFEVRSRLSSYTQAPVLRDLQIGANLSLVSSRVDIPGPADSLNTELNTILTKDPEADTTRPLVGQSPYIVNIDATYQNIDSGTTISLLYNVFGERLSIVAADVTPDIFEQPRPQLDLRASQVIGDSGVTVKLGFENVLGSDFELSQEFRGTTYVYQSYEIPRQFSMGVSYDF